MNSLIKRWSSPEHQEMMNKSNDWVSDCVEGWEALPVQHKLDALQAICYIIAKSEREGTSHRGLMDDLGVYPEGFHISDLMDIHNALFTYFHNEESGLQTETNEPHV